MPKYKPRRRVGHGEIVPPLSKQERIEELLKIQLETFPQKELTPDEIERWNRDLSSFPLEAIEYAFEQHRQLAMFFPVPSQILDICKTWAPAQEFTQGCDISCRERHGKGYNWDDMKILWDLISDRVKSDPARPITDEEVKGLLDQLDKKRGSSPVWRKAA